MLDQQADTLTFSAILALPSRVAYNLSTLATGEVSKSIISGPAEDRAAVAIVVLITQEAIGVTQLGPVSCLHVFEPFFSNAEVALSGDPADQTLRIFCLSKK